MKAVILAGGYGKRLRPLTDTIPKPLIEIAGKPIIDWEISWLHKCGINSFVILCGYLKEKLITHLDGRKEDMEFVYSHEDEPLGTGGALRRAKDLLKGEEQFAMFNGDTISNIDIRKIRLKDDEVASIGLVPLRSTYGITVLEGDKIVSFMEKPLLSEYWMNAGVYVMSSRIFDYLPQGSGSLETSTFVELSKEKLLGAHRFKDAYFKSIDSIKDVEEANAYLSKNDIF
ncbi:MAG: nucleotidyltransferase family protein [Candidatus Micrarchaeota archaeon]|nr:nucleotidyltransferase family protein [Candidatus Micrarchaeota archaeon]